MYNEGGTGYIVGMYAQQGWNRIYCRYVCTTRMEQDILYIPTIYHVPLVVHTYLQYILLPPCCTYIPTIYHVPPLLYIHTYNISCLYKWGTGYIVGMYVQQGGNRIYCRYVCTTRGNKINCRYVWTTRGYLQYILLPPCCTYIPTIYHVPPLLFIHTYNISCSPLVHTYLQYILFPPCCTEIFVVVIFNKGGTGYIVGMFVQQGGNRIYCRYVCTTRGEHDIL
jgi:hypothetical protein